MRGLAWERARVLAVAVEILEEALLEAVDQAVAEGESVTALAGAIGVSRSTLYRRVAERRRGEVEAAS